MYQEWLNLNAPGFRELRGDEKDEIMHFSILWSLFECQVLGTNASAKMIHNRIHSFHERNLLTLQNFEKFLNYFKQRYIENGHTNYRFNHLHLRRNDLPSLVEQVLLEETEDLCDILTALLIITYRYRNNFFHGEKWAYGFREQHSNFFMANELLMKVNEINNTFNPAI